MSSEIPSDNTSFFSGDETISTMPTTPFSGQLTQNGTPVSAENPLPVSIPPIPAPVLPSNLKITNAEGEPIPVKIVASAIDLGSGGSGGSTGGSGTLFDGIIRNSATQRIPVVLDSVPSHPVTISGTPSVSVSGTTDVRVMNPTTAVSITGTPTVALVGTPAVSISGAIPAHDVTLVGTPQVTLAGTPSVRISNPTTGVEILNQPTVTLASSAMTVTNALKIDTTTAPLRVEVTNPSSGGGTGGTFDGNVTVTGGSVNVANFPATQNVAVQGTVPVSLASVPTHPVTISGTPNVVATLASNAVNATIVGTPTVSVNSIPAITLNNPYDGQLRLGASVVSSSNRLPVDVAGSVNVSNALNINTTTPLRVEVTNPSSGGGTGGSVEVMNFPATQPVSIANAVTVANPVTSVSINNLPTTQAVSFADPITVANPFDGVLTLGGVAVSNSNRLPVNVTGSVSLNGTPVVGLVGGSTIQLTMNGTNVSASNRYPVEVQFPTTQAVSITGTPAVSVSGTVTTTPTRSAPAVGPSNMSGTITTGGTAQQIAAANADRRGGWIQNNSTSDLWLNDLGTATIGGSSLKIPAGGYYEFPATGVPTGALSIIGPNTGQAWSGRVW